MRIKFNFVKFTVPIDFSIADMIRDNLHKGGIIYIPCSA